MNEHGHSVDSWIAIKKPQGNTYFYYDSDKKIFDISPYSLNDTSNGALTHTIKQLWNINSDISYVIYNDQVPKIYNIITNITNNIKNNIRNNIKSNNINSSTTFGSTTFGHTKGFFAFDKHQNGFWITHSIPLFPIGPKNTDKYLGLGGNAWTYGQNILCLSVDASIINELANKFLLNKPQIYDAYLNTKKYEYINDLVDGKYSTQKLCESSILSTKAGMDFKIFSKTAEWNDDLYSGCVTPSEKDTLWVESWIRGSAEGPICPITDYDTLDITYLDFGINSSWPETKDHSKWAITVNKKIICMGDINRMTTQYLRGGGTACFTDEILHKIFKTATVNTNTCNHNNL
jgi:deoxyribonuclease-2